MTAVVAATAPVARTRRWRPRRSTVVVAVLVLLALVVAALGRRQGGYTADDDPANGGGNGARAVTHVLERDGVQVDVVRSAAAFDRTTVDARTTVVVTSTDQLGRTTAQDLLTHASAGHVVLVDPSYAVLGALGDAGDLTTHAGSVTGSCPDAFGGLFDGLTLRADQLVAYAGGDCFTDRAGRGVLASRGGVVFFGGGQALSNDQVLRGDDAAVALRLLGQSPRLVWYVPTSADVPAADAVGIGTLLPDWLMPSLGVGLLALLLVVAWRARRLGPLVTEPLPVWVRAVETTRSRGRLYRRSGDRAHAARVLRGAARRRLAEHLRLPGTVDAATLVRDVAARSGRDVAEVGALLLDDAPPPTSDPALIHLATTLSELDREVRTP